MAFSSGKNVAKFSGSQRVVLITGCSAGGIGHCLALEFAKSGCKVYASARNISKVDTELSRKGIELVELDVTDNMSVDAAVNQILRNEGRIDVLVNNAGISISGPVVEVDVSKVQQAMDTNFTGCVRVTHAVAPHMMDRRRGVIVNVGSVVGYAAMPWLGYYAASKAALHAMTDAMRMELAPFNVHVVVLAPGTIKSNISSSREEGKLLADDSRYISIIGPLSHLSSIFHDNAWATDKFVQKVVPQILSDQPRAYISYGGGSVSAWMMYFAPPWIRDALLSRKFGVQKLTEILAVRGTGSKRSFMRVASRRPAVWASLVSVIVAAILYGNPGLRSRIIGLFIKQ
ncbi:NADPH-dependent 1-acyl dihydroxyacetone phosphate reductase [Coemansia sp. Benny D115]|nr:NADPH-dependent 1-acyl dihydroxyacetone phosphate reductase [Coemansia sp. Benny D115]